MSSELVGRIRGILLEYQMRRVGRRWARKIEKAFHQADASGGVSRQVAVENELKKTMAEILAVWARTRVPAYMRQRRTVRWFLHGQPNGWEND